MKVKIRFPNESFQTEIDGFKKEEFKYIKRFKNEILGEWRGAYVFVDITDYKKL